MIYFPCLPTCLYTPRILIIQSTLYSGGVRRSDLTLMYCSVAMVTIGLVFFSFQPKPIDVSVITHHMQRYAVWFGGSMLASTVSWGKAPHRSQTIVTGIMCRLPQSTCFSVNLMNIILDQMYIVLFDEGTKTPHLLGCRSDCKEGSFLLL